MDLKVDQVIDKVRKKLFKVFSILRDFAAKIVTKVVSVYRNAKARIVFVIGFPTSKIIQKIQVKIELYESEIHSLFQSFTESSTNLVRAPSI